MKCYWPYLIFLFVFCLSPLVGQEFNNDLEDYQQYKDSSFQQRRFKHDLVKQRVAQHKENCFFEVQTVGHSVENREIYLISAGKGSKDILLWSQMHGDEPTATMAIFDLLNFLEDNPERLKGIRLHFIPMLNPDGAERFARRNALGIDINRDARRPQSPEAKTLKRVRDSIEPEFGFNLHDQGRHYNVQGTGQTASISFLAPAYNEEKELNDTRSAAMRLIGAMQRTLSPHLAGQMGRYSDSFEPRAFGDNMQLWGTSTILIESGGLPGDREKQFLRKMNYLALLKAFQSIASDDYKNESLEGYFQIPRNDRKLFDLKISDLTYSYLGQEYTVDLGIDYEEVENETHSAFYLKAKIVDIGDLSGRFGYEELSAKGLQFETGQTYPKILNSFEELDNLDLNELHKAGYTRVSVMDLPSVIKFTDHPINLVDIKKVQIARDNSLPKPPIQMGMNPNFILKENAAVKHLLINGFVKSFDAEPTEGQTKAVPNGIVE